MSYAMGWFSTGRDEAARELLQRVYENISNGVIPGRIGYIFCNRRPGETLESDRFIELAKGLDIKVTFLSSSEFEPHFRLASTEIWRAKYHEAVMNRVQQYGAEVIVLVGYMLIVSPEMCKRYTMINLHPAKPGGPKGTWQEVIWQLIRNRASETGAMMHLVTNQLDEGPPMAYCTFPIRGEGFDALWADLERKLMEKSTADIIEEEGEGNALFMEIRRQGVRREVPLMVYTLKALAEGRVRVTEGKVLNAEGEEVGSILLNDQVEWYLREMEPEWCRGTEYGGGK
jgi:phosphoribosylglycinamide formyltransferase-1